MNTTIARMRRELDIKRERQQRELRNHWSYLMRHPHPARAAINERMLQSYMQRVVRQRQPR